MNILVIGSNGQLARSLAEFNQVNNHQLVTAGRTKLDFTKLDKISDFVATQKPDLVINAAAYTAVDLAETNEDAANIINAEAPKVLAITCEIAKIPLIHISTDYVFDGESNQPYCENDIPAPLTAYGRSKLKGEQLVAKHCERHLILRTAWVFSPYGKNFLKTMLSLAINKPTLDVVADQTGNPTYAPHLASSILNICAQLDTNANSHNAWGIYHVAGSGYTNWHQFAKEIFRQSDRFENRVPQVNPILSDAFPTLAKRPMNSRLDCSKIQDNFGISLPNWQLGVEQCITHLFKPKRALTK